MTSNSPAAQPTSRSLEDLETENRELLLRIHEAEETIRAIRSGSVDGFMVDGDAGQQVYTLEGADRPYRLVIEQMQQGAATLLADGTIAYCNATLAVLLKVPHQKLIGSSFWEFVAPDDVMNFADPLAQMQSPVQGEARLLRSDREALHTFLTFNSLPRDCGASIGVLVTDLTTQRLQEQQNRELRDTKLLQDISSRLIHASDAGALYQQILEAAVQLTGADKGTLQLFNTTTAELQVIASHGIAPELHGAFATVTSESGTSCAMALKTRKRAIIPDFSEGEYFDSHAGQAHRAAGVLAAQTTPLTTRSGELLGMMSTHWSSPHRPDERALRMMDILARQAADLIERRKAEEELRQSKIALTEADRRKDEFLATLAHELRNPLAPIRNGLHIMRNAPSSERVEQLRNMMDRQVNHLVRLIDDLLDVSRVSQGKIDLRRQRITLQDAIESATEASRPLIDDNHHTLTVTVPEEPLWLYADLTRVAQVIGNLLNNAAKYTSEGGSIALTAYSDGKCAVLAVADTGVGIPAEMLPKVFDLFTQVDRTLERSHGGLGIGLALVKQLIEMHGGEIAVTSAGADQGSTFTIRLPLATTPGDVQWNKDDTGPGATAAQSPLRILVVDDNVPAAQTTGWMLESIGHELKLAYDAATALIAAREFRPDVILLDIGLPGTNGYDLCRELRRDPLFKATLFIAQTGWGQERDRRLAREAGFAHYLVKPVNFAQLSTILAEVRRA